MRFKHYPYGLSSQSGSIMKVPSNYLIQLDVVVKTSSSFMSALLIVPLGDEAAN